MNRATTRVRKLRTFCEMEEAERQAICSRIAEAREQAGLTQDNLADLLHVHKRTVENYEHGRVPWERLEEIAKLTHVSREWLMFGEEGPVAQPAVREIIRAEVEEGLAGVLQVLARLEARLNGHEPHQADDEPPESK